MIRLNGRVVPHPGYYWLAYDWRNLLLSCVLCNQVAAQKKYGKGNRFPVEGRYAEARDEEATERPKLLHPCWDTPEDHIEFDDTGVFTDKTERGRATINVLGLNARDLPDERAEKYEQTLSKFYSIMAQLPSNGPAWVNAELRKLRADKKQAYVAAARAAYKKAVGDILTSIASES